MVHILDGIYLSKQSYVNESMKMLLFEQKRITTHDKELMKNEW